MIINNSDIGKDETRYFGNDDMSRVVRAVPFGFACYTAHVEGENLVGEHAGVVSSADEAAAWLCGKQPASFLKVYSA